MRSIIECYRQVKLVRDQAVANNMMYDQKLNTFNLINITVEEIVILTAIETCGLLNYLELSFNIFLHIIIIDIVTNKHNRRIKDYNTFLIVIAVIKLLNIIKKMIIN